MNITILIGRLTKDVELKYTTQSQMAVSEFTLAVDRMKKDETDFIRCKAFGKTAEAIEKYCGKGSLVSIQGRLQVSSWEKDGSTHYKTEVIVDRVEFLGKKNQGSESPADTFAQINEEVPF